MSADKATTLSYATSGGVFAFGGLTAQEWALAIGALCAIATFAVTVYFRRKELRLQRHVAMAREARAAELHRQQMAYFSHREPFPHELAGVPPLDDDNQEIE
jgi:hypothetical protein